MSRQLAVVNPQFGNLSPIAGKPTFVFSLRHEAPAKR
jgi:hypothetical protein